MELLDDSALVRCSVDGDHNAWDQLVQRYERLIYSVSEALCPDWDTESVFHGVFIDLYQHLEEVPAGRALAEWLVTAVRKKCLRIHVPNRNSEVANREYLLACSRIPLLIEEHLIEHGIDRLPPDCRHFLKAPYDDDVNHVKYRICLRKLRTLLRPELSLLIESSRASGASHPTDNTWIDLVGGRIAPEERSTLEMHLVECERCFRQYCEWRSFIALLDCSHLKSAPDDCKSKAMTIFPEMIPLRGLPVIGAKKIFDSYAQTARGIRSVRTREGMRHFVFASEDIDIHLRIGAVNGVNSVLGQILSKSTGDFPGRSWLSLTRNRVELASMMSTHFGEFRFQNVPEGKLTLTADVPARRCRITAKLQIIG